MLAAPLRGLCRLALSQPVPANLRACVRACRVLPPLGGDERAVLVKRVGQFVRTAPVAA